MRNLLLLIARNAEPLLSALFTDLQNRPLGSQSEILFIDDASTDSTHQLVKTFFDANRHLSGHWLRNMVQQGFGANQKVGLRYAIDHGFETVTVFYVQDRYAIADISRLLAEYESRRDVACVMATNLLDSSTSSGLGHRFFARIFHSLLNVISGFHLTDWSSSCRIYSVLALQKILFELNSHERQFDIEILLELMDIKLPVVEIAIPSSRRTFYFGHTLRTVWKALKVSLRYRFQRYHLFYDIRYHPELLSSNAESLHESSVYQEKILMESPHTAVIRDPDLVPHGSHVLDVGCATGYVAEALRRERECRVIGVDMLVPEAVTYHMDEYRQVNLETDHQKIRELLGKKNFDIVIMLDVLEHLSYPELFLLNSFRMPLERAPKFVLSTANVAFFVVRILLLFGIFNYGTRGILDVTHKRLFTLRTFRNLMEQTGFIVVGKRYFPFPFAMLGLPRWLSQLLQSINQFLIRLSPSLFSYQILYEAVPLASPQKVLAEVI